MELQYDLNVPVRIADLSLDKLLDEEKLVRLHPHWFIESKQDRDTLHWFQLRDYATDREFELGLRLHAAPAQEGEPGVRPLLCITLRDHPVQEIFLYMQDGVVRVRMRCLSRLSPEQEQDMLLWIRAIQEYLRLYTSTTPQTLLFRGIMNFMMLKMNPSQRKITIMLTKITVIELLVTVIIVVGYVYFR